FKECLIRVAAFRAEGKLPQFRTILSRLGCQWPELRIVLQSHQCCQKRVDPELRSLGRRLCDVLSGGLKIVTRPASDYDAVSHVGYSSVPRCRNSSISVRNGVTLPASASARP